ncbi:MAG: methylenetetrahydrofolate dehydrogenase (NADP+)/methenyltetrahydrofolate cyclohydrolase [Candidatus Paceibacteria bacterium]|jgi:methylenetetrahydrofolate dehydrogenase (NADP+)/methenyltetrahydrofolate cyclohydrolase
MIVDGRAIAASILDSVAVEVAGFSRAPRLSAITCAPNFETQKYLKMKKKKAATAGITLSVVELPADASTEEVVACVEQVVKESDGVVVQLPLPAHINIGIVLAAVPVDKDPDGFLYGKVPGACLPPVVGAIDEIAKIHNLVWEDKTVVVLGAGKLVGLPAAVYARQAGAIVSVLIKETYDECLIKKADIIISGIGQPGFIKPALVKRGVVIFDAGTSDDGGVLVGDVDPLVAEKASLITPVPGGIGPITIAYLLRNLVNLRC